MRTHLKRLLRVGLVGMVALVFVVPAHFVWPTSAQAAEGIFDESDLNGEYACLVTGKFDTADAASLVRIVADGEGNLTLEQRRDVGGTTSCTGVRSCTYVIQSSGFGTITCPPFTPPPPCVGSGSTATVDILLSDGGRQFDLLLEGPAVLSGHCIRQ
jgi:hypothetical protein